LQYVQYFCITKRTYEHIYVTESEGNREGSIERHANYFIN